MTNLSLRKLGAKLVFAFALAFGLNAAAYADVASDVGVSGATCPDAKFFSGSMIRNLCWKCFFPIRIMGIPIGGGPIPDDAAAPFCVCPGRTFGIPSPGITLGLWEPRHLFEMVRQPWCSPVFGKPLIKSKTKLGVSGLARWGGYKPESMENPQSMGAYYNWHWWAYPVNVLLDSLIGSVCSTKGGYDMDLLYFSEIDPTWNNDELAFYTQPEAKLFSNPLVIASCAADAVASTVNKPIQLMYWCAGTWGHAYPFTGNVNNADSPPRNTSLLTFRALAALHRRTLAKKTYGNDSVCRSSISPMIPKQQYRLQTFYPLPEKSGNHWLGASPFEWGEWRNIPMKGEDYVILEWAFSDCCVTFW
ncbi:MULTISPECIES: TraU family protein [unclassified Dyella]|uniref:TraU family protein n=1 Tax=Dyella sp. ASV21 TaxID=2795114 RepID=UPI0018EB3991|nr:MULTISPECIES: TraU family protein [unclassified Dyella]